jgi:hypothetical protein
VSPNVGFWTQLAEFEHQQAQAQTAAGGGGGGAGGAPIVYDEDWARQSAATYSMSPHCGAGAAFQSGGGGDAEEEVRKGALIFVLFVLLLSIKSFVLSYVCPEPVLTKTFNEKVTLKAKAVFRSGRSR